MMHSKLKLLALSLLLFMACTSKKDLNEFMVNSWQTSYLKIDMQTHNNSDSLYVFEDRFENKSSLIAQSIYRKDGTFSAWYLTQEGVKKSESEGTWKVDGDSLTVAYKYNTQEVKYSYHIQMTDSGFIAKSLADWDNDGQKDDRLLMKTKSIKLNE